MKKALIILAVFVLSIFAGYRIGAKNAIKVSEAYRIQIEEETLENNPIPQCSMGDCPEYKYFDVDGDGKRETIAIEPLGMSQMAGRVIIIDERKVVFVGERRMRIWVDPIDEGNQENGFIISYSTVANSNKDVQRDYYKFVDGKYILEKSETPNDP